jgi:hypothetical protein
LRNVRFARVEPPFVAWQIVREIAHLDLRGLAPALQRIARFVRLAALVATDRGQKQHQLRDAIRRHLELGLLRHDHRAVRLRA